MANDFGMSLGIDIMDDVRLLLRDVLVELRESNRQMGILVMSSSLDFKKAWSTLKDAAEFRDYVEKYLKDERKQA